MSKLGFNLEDNVETLAKQYPMALMNDVDGDEKILAGDKEYMEMYLNVAQHIVYDVSARYQYVLAARGMGKTTISSLRLYNCYSTIPKGAGVFMGATIKQLYTKTMPNLVKSLEQLRGVHEGTDFVRGKPDKRWGWDMPHAIPRIWENVITFPNGCCVYLISTGVASAANGMNLMFAMSDETRFLDFPTYVQSIRPALRGEPWDHPGYRRWENPMYLSEFFVSDGGIIKKQQIWEEEENKIEPEQRKANEGIIKMIAQLRYLENVDRQNRENGNPTDFAWQLAHNKNYCQQIQYLRCKAKFFHRFSSLHNIEILGEDYIKARKRDMPPLLYDVQILGHRASLDKSTRFYPCFDATLHTYKPNEAHETDLVYSKHQAKYKSVIDIGGTLKKSDYEAPDLDELSTLGDNCTLDVDIQPGKPLRIAHDYNSNVNTVVTGQDFRMNGIEYANILSSMFVVNPKMLEDLMEDWHRYYFPHKYTCKDVILYYDSTAKQGQSYASRVSLDEQYTFYKIIQRVLTEHGWNVIMVDMGSPMRHEIKFEFINGCFTGKEKYMPRINDSRNDYLIASLENALTTTKFGRVHKDKSTEKKKSGQGMSEDDELGTNNLSDMSDAFDSLMRGFCHFGDKVQGKWGRSSVHVWMPD